MIRTLLKIFCCILVISATPTRNSGSDDIVDYVAQSMFDDVFRAIEISQRNMKIDSFRFEELEEVKRVDATRSESASTSSETSESSIQLSSFESTLPLESSESATDPSATPTRNSGSNHIIDYVAQSMLDDVFRAIEISLSKLNIDSFRFEESEEVKEIDASQSESDSTSSETSESSSSVVETTLQFESSESATDPSSSEFSSTIENISSNSPISVQTTLDSFAESSAEFMLTSNNNDITNMRVFYDQNITKLEQTIRDLQKLVDELGKKVDDSEIKNKKCESKLHALRNELSTTKKFVDMRKYSKALQKKLNEFPAFEDSKKNFSNFSIKFSVFEITNDKMSGNILTNNELYILPPEIGSIVGNVTEFSASRVGLLAANKDAFTGMNQLKRLNLSWNKISEIEKENFVELTELKSLDLSNNLIEILETNAFLGLNELQELNLSHNLLSIINLGTFDCLLNLKILNLSFNKIQNFKEEIFTGINVIEEFYASNNQINLMNPSIVSVFQRSKLIDLSGNICIDLSFPENSTIFQLFLDVAKNCWKSQL